MLSPAHSAVSVAEAGPLMLALLAVAGLASALLLGLGLAAFARRRSRAYLLVVLALAALLARTLVAVGAEAGMLSLSDHHLAEHGLDVAMAALVVGAVVYARTAVPRGRPGRAEETSDGRVESNGREGADGREGGDPP